ncbi:hypothetical protein BGZ94_006007, partial [Podila epigama]
MSNQQQNQTQPPGFVKNDSQIKQEPYQSPTLNHPQYQQPPQQQQQQYQQHFSSTYSQPSSSTTQTQHYGGSQTGSTQSFQGLPPNPYNLANHLMNMNVQNGPSSSSSTPGVTLSGVSSVHHSGTTTPAMTNINPLSNASAPSSPVLSHLQYPQYNHNSTGLYSQHQQQQPYSSGSGVSTLNSNFYPSSPPHQQQQQEQSMQQPSYHQQSGQPSQPSQQSQQQPSSSYGQFNSGPSTAPTMRPQYAPLVPPLTDAQYAQYQQLLASPFSSAASTPYHSNQSTPYSSMPASPTLEYQQLPDGGTITPKPKRRQVKNAC